jgi:iron(III) transport system ATP-binding protein
MVRAVDDLALTVEDREILVILGPSGSGKTTLLRCIAGLERADSGAISIDERVVYSSAEKVWIPPEQRGISMVFQSYALWPHMTAFENVAYPLRAGGIGGDELRGRVMKALALVGCGALERRHPTELSGGQQQRVALARAIVGGSRVVLFDEPLSNVDARVREELRHELVALQRQLGFTAIYITHDQVEAMAIGHRVAVLDDGKIIQVGPPRELYRRPRSRAVATFMGATNQLAGVVEKCNGTGVVATTPLGQICATVGHVDFAAEMSVTLVFRPEDCRVVTTAPERDAPNHWSCQVEQALFFGNKTEYTVRVGGASVVVRSDTDEELTNGASAWLAIPPGSVYAVPT